MDVPQRIALTTTVVLTAQCVVVAALAGPRAGAAALLCLPLLAVNALASVFLSRAGSRAGSGWGEPLRHAVSGLVVAAAPLVIGPDAHAWQLALPVVLCAALGGWSTTGTTVVVVLVSLAAAGGALAAGASPAFAVAVAVALVAAGLVAGVVLAQALRERAEAHATLDRLRLEAARRERSQEELRAERVDLERHVEERTRELAEANAALTREVEERRVAEAEAIEASRTKSSFLANMSHELRTPLNAIIGYTDMILDGIDEFDRESIGNDLHTVRKSAENLLEIVNDILDLSKIEAGKMDVRVETFPVGELLEELAKTTTPLAMRQRNTFKLTYSRLLGKIKTDRGKLRQILLNLLANACKFTHKGRIELRVDLKMESGTPWFVFTVSDSGIGIAREKVDRLFAPFTQADESSTRKYGGTGLGLALVRHFTEMLGGVISVESELGAGSSFKVKLPRELADPQVEGALMISVH